MKHLFTASILAASLVALTSCQTPPSTAAGPTHGVGLQETTANGNPVSYDITPNNITATVSAAGHAPQTFTGRDMADVQAKLTAAGL